MTREEILLAKWEKMKPHERNDLIFYDVLDRMPLDTTPNEFGGFGTIPRYTEDIKAAWEVVEKMRERKIYLDIRVWPDEYQVLPHLDENNKLIERAIVKKKSLPEAICKSAALLAVLEG